MSTPNDVSGKLFECDALLFDLDGVLIDSTDCIMRHWKVWADRHGVDLNRITEVAHGLRTVETMRSVAPHLDAASEAQLFTELEIADTDGVMAIDGAQQLISTIPRGSWTIVTSGSLELVKQRLKRAGLPVPDLLVTADDVSQGKPAPEPYLLGAKRLGVDPRNCVVIEDAPSGIVAGKRAGMRVIAIASTHSRQALLETEADAVVDRLSDLSIGKAWKVGRLAIQLK